MAAIGLNGQMQSVETDRAVAVHGAEASPRARNEWRPLVGARARIGARSLLSRIIDGYQIGRVNATDAGHILESMGRKEGKKQNIS